jgi:hypothetical protein
MHICGNLGQVAFERKTADWAKRPSNEMVALI